MDIFNLFKRVPCKAASAQI